MAERDYLRRVFSIVSNDFDAGDFGTFRNRMNDRAVAERVYDFVSQRYDAGDFGHFSKQLGLAFSGQETGGKNGYKAGTAVLPDYRSATGKAGNNVHEARNAEGGFFPLPPVEWNGIMKREDRSATGTPARPYGIFRDNVQAQGAEAKEKPVSAYTKERYGKELPEGNEADAPLFRVRDIDLNTVPPAMHRYRFVSPFDGKEIGKADGETEERWNEAKAAIPKQAEALRKKIPDDSRYRIGGGAEGEAARDYASARNFLDDAERVMRQAETRKGDNAFTQFGKAFGDEITNPDTYSMGVNSLDNAARLVAIANKVDKEGTGSLTEPEKALAEAFTLAQAAQDYYAGDLSTAQRLGSGTAATIPFMAQIAATSGIGAAATASLRKMTAKIAEGLAKRGAVAKVGGKLGKAIADTAAKTAVMTGVQVPSTTANVLERSHGSAEYGYNPESGRMEFSGFGRAGADEAVAKGLTSAWIENFSEMSGGALGAGSSLARKSLNRLVPRAGKTLDKVANQELLNRVNGWAKRAGWNGTLEEFFEEQVGLGMNALLTGDNEWSDFADGQRQLETFLQVALVGGVITAANTGAAQVQKQAIRKRYEAAEGHLLSSFGTAEGTNDVVTALRETVRNGSLEEIDGFISSLAAEQTETPDGKRMPRFDGKQLAAARGYAVAATNYNALIGGVKDRVTKEAEQYGQEIAASANPDMGAVVTAFRSNDHPERGLSIKGGEIVFGEDGRIDYRRSSDIVYYDGEGGKCYPLPVELLEWAVAVPVERAVEEGVSARRGMLLRREAAEIEGREESPDSENGGEKAGEKRSFAEGVPLQRNLSGKGESVYYRSGEKILAEENGEEAEAIKGTGGEENLPAYQDEVRVSRQPVKRRSNSTDVNRPGEAIYRGSGLQKKLSEDNLLHRPGRRAAKDNSGENVSSDRSDGKISGETKGLAGLSSASSNYQQEIDKQDLSSAAKIVESFKNTTIEDGKKRAADVSEEVEMDGESIEEVNERFNERLEELINGANGSRRLSCGRAGALLRSAGITDAEIVLDFDKAVRKSTEGYKIEYPFDLTDLKGLPVSINAPIAVFDSESHEGDKVILTELQRDGRNFIVAIRAKEEPRKGGKILEINEITTLFPKDKKGVIKWILDGKGDYYEKVKALNWLGHPQNHSESPANQELLSAAKIVESFKNPTIKDGKKRVAMESLPEALHTPAGVVNDTKKLPGNKAADESRPLRNSRENGENIPDTESSNNPGKEQGKQKDLINLQDNTERDEIERAKRGLESLYGGNEAVRRTFAEAGNRGRGHRAATETGRSGRPKESLLRSIVQRAKENRAWIENVSSVTTNFIGRGQENDVYLSKDGWRVIKLNNLSFLPDHSENLHSFTNRILTHNALFPNEFFTVIGFAENSKGMPCVVLSQPYVSSYREATDTEIDAFLENAGFTADRDNAWFDGRYELTDLKTSNVLVDRNGRLRFIDVVAKDRNFKWQKLFEGETAEDSLKSMDQGVPSFFSRNDNPRFREDDFSEVNEQFNNVLSTLTEGNARSKLLSLGMPSEILLAAGVTNKPIRLYGAKIVSKAKKHGYDVGDVKDLPIAIQTPIAVFKGSKQGSSAILTELQINGKNVLVSLSVGKGGHDVDFNIISSIYGKKGENIVRWITDGKLLYVDKAKALDYISVPAPIAGAQSNQELSSVTNIIKNFENPTLTDGKKRVAMESLPEALHTPAGVVNDSEKSPEGETAEDRRRNKSHTFRDEEGFFRSAKREQSDLTFTNNKFNAELQQQIEGLLPEGHIYSLGQPSDALLCAGIPDLPIELSSERLERKASSEYENNHPFNLRNVKNLPEALAFPIAIFNTRRKNGAKVILTELNENGNNFIAAIQVRKSDDSRKIDVEINSIRSIYPKDRKNGIIEWINAGLMNWVDKKKASDFFSTQWPNYIASGKNTGSLSSVTNIIKNFENPTLTDGKKRAAADELSDVLHTQVRIVNDTDELPEEGRRRNAKGWYDTESGEVVVVLPNNRDGADVQATVLHEVVGHKGLRRLLGDNFSPVMERVYEVIPEDVLKSMRDEYKGRKRDRVFFAEEFLSRMAEGGGDASLWEKVKGVFREFFRSLGIDLKLSVGDLRYLLYRSRKFAEKGEAVKNAGRGKSHTFRDEEGTFLFREPEGYDAASIDSEFNRELQQLTEGSLPDGHIFNLGKPGGVLQNSGFSDLPIILKKKRLEKKSQQQNHPFSVAGLFGLPASLQAPVAVFESRTEPESKVVVTGLPEGNRNFIAAIRLQKRVTLEGETLFLHEVQSVYPKSLRQTLSWIKTGSLLRWADKRKFDAWVARQDARMPEAATAASVAELKKLLEDFGNFTLREGEIDAAMQALSKVLRIPIETTRQGESRSKGIQKSRRRGILSPSGDRVAVILDNTPTAGSAQAGVLHELVRYKGLEQALGKHFVPLMKRVYKVIPPDVKERLRKEYGSMPGGVAYLTKRYLGGMAERGGDLASFEKVRECVKEYFKEQGAELQLQDGDLLYLFWKAENRLRPQEPLPVMAEKKLIDEALQKELPGASAELFSLALQRARAEAERNRMRNSRRGTEGMDAEADENERETTLEKRETENYPKGKGNGNAPEETDNGAGAATVIPGNGNATDKSGRTERAVKNSGNPSFREGRWPFLSANPFLSEQGDKTDDSTASRKMASEGEVSSPEDMAAPAKKKRKRISETGVREQAPKVLEFSTSKNGKETGKGAAPEKESSKEKKAKGREKSQTELANEKELRAYLDGDRGATLQAVNARFNREVRDLADGTVPERGMFRLGRRGNVLQSTGMPEGWLVMDSNILTEYPDEEARRYFRSSAENLPTLLQNPVAVFSYQNAEREQAAIVRTVHEGSLFIADIRIEKGEDGEPAILRVTSFYPKNPLRWLRCIEQGKLLRADDKGTLLALIEKCRNEEEAKTEKPGIDFGKVAAIVNDFRNPPLYDGEMEAAATAFAGKTGCAVRFPRPDERAAHEGEKGWYDPESGSIVVAPEVHTGTDDLQATLLSELAGHRDLWQLGEWETGRYAEQVYRALTETERREVDAEAFVLRLKEGWKATEGHKGDIWRRKAVEGYLAQLAEADVSPGTVKGVCAVVRRFLHGATGVRAELTDNDIVYLMWRTGNRLRPEDSLRVLAEKSVRDNVLRKSLGTRYGKSKGGTELF